jgi:hypothetical protein
MARQTPEEEARARLRDQVAGAAAAAPAIGMHEGHWSLHHIALPAHMPGDFTPVPAPEYAEEQLSLFGELLERLATICAAPEAEA